jgi:integrase
VARGTIQRRGNGRWTLRIYVGKRQREITLTGDLATVAARERAADNVRLRLGLVATSSRTTLERFATWWFLPVVDGRLRASTAKDYRWRFNKYIAGRVEAQKQLWEYRTVDVQNLLNGVAMDHPHLAKASLQRIKALLSAIFRHATVAGFRDSNCVRDVLLPGRATPLEQSRMPGVYDLVTVRKVLATSDLPPDVRCAAAVAAFAGLRLAELRGLRWEDIDVQSTPRESLGRSEAVRELGSITVTRTKWQDTVNAPKSRASGASVPVIPELARALRVYRDWWLKQPVVMLKREDFSGSIDLPDTSLFGPDLPAKLRYHLSRAFQTLPSQRVRASRTLVRSADIKYRGMHAFRRCLASELFERGAEDLDVSHVLRHSKVIVTRDSYIKRFDSRTLATMSTLTLKKPNKGSARDCNLHKSRKPA